MVGAATSGAAAEMCMSEPAIPPAVGASPCDRLGVPPFGPGVLGSGVPTCRAVGDPTIPILAALAMAWPMLIRLLIIS